MNIKLDDIVDSYERFVLVTDVLAGTLNFAEPMNKLMITAFKRAVESNTPPLLEIDQFGDTIDASEKTKEWVLKYLFKCMFKPRLRHAGYRIKCDAGWMANEIMGHDFVSIALTGESSAQAEATTTGQAAVPSAAPEKVVQAAPVVTPVSLATKKQRTDSLDAPIQKAIKQAGCHDTAAVFTQLKELALNGEALPFTGVFEGAAFCYTNDSDMPAILTKDALGKRLAKLRK